MATQTSPLALQILDLYGHQKKKLQPEQVELLMSVGHRLESMGFFSLHDLPDDAPIGLRNRMAANACLVSQRGGKPGKCETPESDFVTDQNFFILQPKLQDGTYADKALLVEVHGPKQYDITAIRDMLGGQFSPTALCTMPTPLKCGGFTSAEFHVQMCDRVSIYKPDENGLKAPTYIGTRMDGPLKFLNTVKGPVDMSKAIDLKLTGEVPSDAIPEALEVTLICERITPGMKLIDDFKKRSLKIKNLLDRYVGRPDDQILKTILDDLSVFVLSPLAGGMNEIHDIIENTNMAADKKQITPAERKELHNVVINFCQLLKTVEPALSKADLNPNWQRIFTTINKQDSLFQTYAKDRKRFTKDSRQ